MRLTGRKDLLKEKKALLSEQIKRLRACEDLPEKLRDQESVLHKAHATFAKESNARFEDCVPLLSKHLTEYLAWVVEKRNSIDAELEDNRAKRQKIEQLTDGVKLTDGVTGAMQPKLQLAVSEAKSALNKLLR